ncbi:MAG TPA: polysaccharide biosynthesis tyrosine autokinase [Polyangiaceae bacterium]|nr:polysaccharide biosynthesis tyrosine autokinase [Polyangiaceae bacterium]
MSTSLPPETPTPASASITLQQFWRSLRRSYPLVLGVALGVTVAVSFYVLGKTKIYRATTTVKIEPASIRPLGDDVQTPGENAENYWWNKEYYETQYRIIRSRRVAEEVSRRLGLHKDPTFLRNLPSGSPVETPAEAPTLIDAANVVQSRLEVTPVKNSRLVELSFEDAEPARAKRVLTTLSEVYIEQNLEAALASRGSAGLWLNGQLGKLKAELEKSEIELHEYKKSKQLLSASLDDQSNMLRAEMQQLNTELTGARAKREQLMAHVTQLNRVSAERPEELPAAELLNSELLRSLRSSYVEAQSQAQSLRGQGKGENHPEMQSAAARAGTAREALLAEVRNVQEAYRRDLTAAEREITGLAGLYESAKKRALDLNLLEIEFNRLSRTKENTEKIYGLVLERAKESDLTGQMRFNNIEVVDPPLLPRAPVKPWVSLSIAAGLFGGLALGVALVFAREQLDRRVKAPSDVEQYVALTCLAVFPSIASEATGTKGRPLGRKARASARGAAPELQVHRQPSGALAEAARALRTNLVFMAPDRPFARILVTSPSPAEGKSTVACSLAITMAQAGKSVLLLDADLRRPRIAQVFDVPNGGGVTSALLEPNGIEQYLVPSEVPNLFLLPSGPLPPNPAELLHSASFERLLETLGKRFDRIVIDSPPLGPVTDAAILSRLVDTTLLVVRSATTMKEAARGAVRALRAVSAPIAGAVLNDVSDRSHDYGYQYYAYQRTGEGGRTNDAPPPPTA